MKKRKLPTREQGRVPVTVWVTPELWQRVKLLSETEDKFTYEVVESIIMDSIAYDGRRRKIVRR